MRVSAILVGLLVLAGCGDRRTFDERYEDTSAKLEEKARALDTNLSANMTDTNQVGAEH